MKDVDKLEERKNLQDKDNWSLKDLLATTADGAAVLLLGCSDHSPSRRRTRVH